jgi:hypothetical protein
VPKPTDDQKRALTAAHGVILGFSPDAPWTCDGRSVRSATDLVRGLEASPYVELSEIDTIISLVEGLATALTLSALRPPVMRLAWISIDTRPSSPLYVDFAWAGEERIVRTARLETCSLQNPTFPCGAHAIHGNLLRRCFGKALEWQNGMAVVTAPPNDNYNCFGWTINRTDIFEWPGPFVDDLDKAYAAHGIERVEMGPIAVWGFLGGGGLRHASRFHSPSGKMESKINRSFRALHIVPQSPGPEPIVPVFGTIQHRYDYKKPLAEIHNRIDTVLAAAAARSHLTEMERRAVDGVAGAVDPDLAKAFEVVYATWRESWYTGAVQTDLEDCRDTPQRESLVALGAAIVPLLMQRALKGEWFAVLPAEQLLPHSVPVRREVGDPENVGEVSRVQETIKVWARSLG